MFNRIVSAVFLVALASSATYAKEDTHAGRAITYSGQAGTATSGSAAHSIAASGQVTSAASAIPLSVGGAVLGSAGAVSAQAAHDSMRAATASPIGTPLNITDEVITTMPPNEALKTNSAKTSDQDI